VFIAAALERAVESIDQERKVVGEKEREDWAHGLVCVCVWQDSNATTAIGAGDEAHPSGVDDGLNDNGPGGHTSHKVHQFSH